MGLQSPKEIEVSGDVLTLLTQVDENIGRVNELRPFSPEVNLKIRNAFLPDRVTATLNIEGIAATRRQTLAIMDALVVSQQVAKEDQEIANALRADEFVLNGHESGAEFSLGFIREINHLVLQEVGRTAGEIRKEEVAIAGAQFVPPAPLDLTPLLTEFVERYNDESVYQHPIVQAAWAHHQLSYIHPFLDGNGRTARLVQDFALLQRGMFPIGVPSSQRDEYYNALQQADAGKWDDIVSLLARNELITLAKIEGIAKESMERVRWITRLASVANERKTGALYKQYVVWKNRVEQIRDAFCRASLELDQSTYVVGATERWWETIEFDEWTQLIKTGRRPGFTWCFSILFFIDGEPFYKLIAFFARHRRESADFTDLRGIVSLQFTGLSARDQERPDFVNFADPDIRIREMLYYEDTLHVAYADPKGLAYRDDLTVEDVIRDVFEDVFYKKGGLSG
jgi:Fic family protein